MTKEIYLESSQYLLLGVFIVSSPGVGGLA